MLDRSQEIASAPIATPAAEARTSFPGFDQRFHAAIARLTGGLSPLALSQAYTDWAEHLLMSPDKQAELVHDLAAAAWARFISYCWHDGPGADCPALHRAASAGHAISTRKHGGNGPSMFSPKAFC